MDNKYISQRIKYLREEKNITQNALANKAGISPTYIYQLERGEKSPTIEYLSLICDALGVSLKDFFDEDFTIKDYTFDNLSQEEKNLVNELITLLKTKN